MLNRQIALLFAVGVAIGIAGLLIAAPASEGAARGPAWAPDAALWVLLGIAGFVLLVSQALITRSVRRARLAGTSRTMEMVWSVAPGALAAAAVAYTLLVS